MDTHAVAWNLTGFARTRSLVTHFGNAIPWAPPFDLYGRLDDRKNAETWYPLAQLRLDNGLLVPQPLEIPQGGLPATEKALYQVRKGQIRGKKIQVPICS